MKYSVQEIDELREAVIARQKQKLRMRRSELNMVHVESMVRTYMEAGVKADEILAGLRRPQEPHYNSHTIGALLADGPIEARKKLGLGEGDKLDYGSRGAL